MNKNLVILASVIVVLIILVAIYMSMQPKNIDTNNVNNGTNSSQQSSDAISQQSVNSQSNGIDTGGKSLKDFMSGALGQNVQCNFSQVSSDNNQVNGTAFVSGKNVRIDFITQIAGQDPKTMHMISDGTYGYVWGDAPINNALQGTKFKIDPNATSPQQGQAGNDKSLDYQTPVTKCDVWNADANEFQVPSNVNFVSIDDLKNPATANPQGAAQSCSICDSLQGDQKSACLGAMKCGQ